MLRIGWFATARTLGGSSTKLLAAALETIRHGLDARIEFVFSNREAGEYDSSDHFFELVRSAGIPLVNLSSNKFRRRAGGPLSRDGEPLPEWRRQYDAEVAKLLEPYDWDIGILAGYMLIFTDVVCERWPLLNLHPALPGGPVGTWQNVIWDLIESKADESGVQWQLATTDLDRGPVMTYCRYSLHGGDIDALWAANAGRTIEELRAEGDANQLFQEIRIRGAGREIPLLAETLKVLARRTVMIYRSDSCRFIGVDGQGLPKAPSDLTPAVERALDLLLDDGSGQD
jgi:phosphoribosylglycinamide formyltransferase-1